LPARVAGYQASDLDTLIGAGEVVWCGVEPIGEADGRVVLYLADKIAELRAPAVTKLQIEPSENPLAENQQQILRLLATRGAMFFGALHEAVGGGFPGETIDALWGLVWSGRVTNDTFHVLRAYMARRASTRSSSRQHVQSNFRSRRTLAPSAQGRWTLVDSPASAEVSPTIRSHAVALQLLKRHGVVIRETMGLENIVGGFSAVYDVLKALEESGRVRRGYFVAGLGGAQFALPSAIDLLRSLRTDRTPEKPEMLCLAATDPANLYGSVLRWPSISSLVEVNADQDTTDAEPAKEGSARMLARAAGARIILRNGELVAYMRRNNRNLIVFLAADEPDRSHMARDLATFLVELGQQDLQAPGSARAAGLLLATVNDVPIAEHFLSRFLLDAGFHASPMGFHLRRSLLAPIAHEPAPSAPSPEVQ
jgi:ATP-dependent Lhr-like helicase